MASRMLKHAHQLLARCELGDVELARRAGVEWEWLRKFRRGKLPDPRVTQFERLYDFLTVWEAARRAGGPVTAATDQPSPPS